MYKGYKVKAFIPAGREKTMSILFKYFIKHSDIVDEVMLWENTTVKSDIDFMRTTAQNMPDLFKCYQLPEGYNFIQVPIQHNTRAFFRYCTDEDTIYVRFDDDIVYIDDDYFKNILDFRIKNKEYFVVFGNIINNAMCGYLQQQAGAYPMDLNNIGEIENGYCMNMKTWGSAIWGIFIHRLLLDRIERNSVSDLYFPDHELIAERFSISNFCFFGSDFKKFNGDIPILDEEIFLTEVYPKMNNVKNVICGNAVVSHYTFSPYQKPAISQTDILEKYSKLAEKKLSEDYYKLLTIQQNKDGKP